MMLCWEQHIAPSIFSMLFKCIFIISVPFVCCECWFRPDICYISRNKRIHAVRTRFDAIQIALVMVRGLKKDRTNTQMSLMPIQFNLWILTALRWGLTRISNSYFFLLNAISSFRMCGFDGNSIIDNLSFHIRSVDVRNIEICEHLAKF